MLGILVRGYKTSHELESPNGDLVHQNTDKHCIASILATRAGCVIVAVLGELRLRDVHGGPLSDSPGGLKVHRAVESFRLQRILMEMAEGATCLGDREPLPVVD